MANPLDEVQVSPETLQFTESRDTTQRFIKISNFASCKIAYRIRVSVQHIFVVPNNEGFVNGNEEIDITVIMKPLSLFPDADLSRIKFAVEIAPVAEGQNGNIKEFLTNNSNLLVRRSVLCFVTRVDLDAEEAQARETEEQVLPDTEEQAYYVEQQRPFQQDIEPLQQIPAIPMQQGSLSPQDLAGNEYDQEEDLPLPEGDTGEYNLEGRNTSPNTELRKIYADTASRNENVAFSIGNLSDAVDSAPADRGADFEPQGDVANSRRGGPNAQMQATVTANQANLMNHKVTGPRGRVLELMVKNVSRDAPLTQDEVAELQEIRGVLNKDDWQEWLTVARKEKYRRQDEASALAQAERERAEAVEQEQERARADVSVADSFYNSMNNTSMHAHQPYQPAHHGGFTPQPQFAPRGAYGRPSGSAPAPAPATSGAPDLSPRPAPPLSQLTMDQMPSTPTSRSRATSRAGTPTQRESRDASYSTNTSTTFNIPREFQRDFTVGPNEARSVTTASPFRQRPASASNGSTGNNSGFQNQRSASPQMTSPQKSAGRGIQAPGAGFPRSHPFGSMAGNFVVDQRLHQSNGPAHVVQRVHESPARARPELEHQSQSQGQGHGQQLQHSRTGFPQGSPPSRQMQAPPTQPQRDELGRANTLTRAAVPQFGRSVGNRQQAPVDAGNAQMGASMDLSRSRYGATPPPPPEEPSSPGTSVVTGTVSSSGTVVPMSTPAMPLQPPTASVSRRRAPPGGGSGSFGMQNVPSSTQQNANPNAQQMAPEWDAPPAPKENWAQSSQYQVRPAPPSPSSYGGGSVSAAPNSLRPTYGSAYPPESPQRSLDRDMQGTSRTQTAPAGGSLVPDLEPQSTPAYLNMMGTGVQTVAVNPTDGSVVPAYTNMNYNTSNKAFNQSQNQNQFRGQAPPSSEMYFVDSSAQGDDPMDTEMQRAALHATFVSQQLRSGVKVRPHQALGGQPVTSDVYAAYSALPVDDTRFDNSNTSYIKHVMPMQSASPGRSRPMSASSNRDSGMSVNSATQASQASRFSGSQRGNAPATVPKFVTTNVSSSHSGGGRIVTPVLRPNTPSRHNTSQNRNMVSRSNMSAGSNLPFTFEGVKYDKAQDRLARVCVAQGPLVKAFEEFPIRVDTENLCCDVVWREYKHNNIGANNIITHSVHSATTLNTLSPTKGSRPGRNSTTHSAHQANQNIQTSNAASVLRRERFNFDDIYAGAGAFHRLTVYTRLRTRQTLLYKKSSLVLLCVGCGEDATLYNKYHGRDSDASSIEPPVAILMGDSGGVGLISAAVDEIFVSLPHLNDKENDRIANLQRKTISARLKTRGNAGARPTAAEKNNSGAPYVTMQAVVLLGDDGATPVDLLSTNSNLSSCSIQQQPVETYDDVTNTNTKSYKSVIANAQSIHLKQPADFERLVGVILGRRSSMYEHVQALIARRNNGGVGGSDSRVRNSDEEEVLLEHLADSPWLVPNNTGTLLITVTVHNNRPVYNGSSTYTGSGSSQKTEFHFVSPCGKLWSTPASDICMLVEAMSCVPHPPPHSLYRSSMLAQLLVHPTAQQSSDYVLLTSVNRRYNTHSTDETNANQCIKYNPMELSNVIQSSLQSLRLVAQLSGIY